jgi:putative CocE/NonD family hydrolase
MRLGRWSTAVALTIALLTWCGTAAASVRQSGYIDVGDGVKLRYTVDLPSEQGRFPVALRYDVYCAGTGCNDAEAAAALLDAGYALLGVSVRGTGCSTGTLDVMSPAESTDGAAAVEWAARRPWSTGRVGMFGISYPGLTQPRVAALRPQGLAAIAPFQIVDDVYRDVAYPGGMFNAEFAGFWGLGDQPEADAENVVNAPGDAECAANYAGHVAPNVATNIFLTAAQHPWFDDYWRSKEVGAAAGQIDVPVLGCQSWQDDEVGSRSAWTLFPRVERSLLWFVGMNGHHSACGWSNDRMVGLLVRFFDRFVRGEDNGFTETPHVQLWHETHPEGGGPRWLIQLGTAGQNTPSWVTTFRRWPPRRRTTRLYLRAGGLLGATAPTEDEAADLYASPGPSPANPNGVVLGQQNAAFKQPPAPGTGVASTTLPLREDVETLGPASADLWLSSTAPDTALQVTITEVRPDGQETYVARGWLQASHRKIDSARSKATFPYQTHVQSDEQPLEPGTPVLARVEVFPFDHVFRAGSRIRMIVDTPSPTGGWGFAYKPIPAVNSILHDPGHPSRLVLGVIPNGHAKKPLPACDTLLNQPCRDSAYQGLP